MTVSEIRRQIKACHPDLRGGNTSRLVRFRKLVSALRRRLCPVCGGAMPFARSIKAVDRMTTCGFMCALARRRKPVGLIAAWLLFGGVSHAGQVKLAWQASPTPNVTYALYATTNTASPPVRITTGTNLVASLDLPAGRWGFWATAVDDNGLESLPSNTVVHDVPVLIVLPTPPVSPSNLRKLLIEIPLDVGSTNWVTNGVVRYRLEP